MCFCYFLPACVVFGYVIYMCNWLYNLCFCLAYIFRLNIIFIILLRFKVLSVLLFVFFYFLFVCFIKGLCVSWRNSTKMIIIVFIIKSQVSLTDYGSFYFASLCFLLVIIGN